MTSGRDPGTWPGDWLRCPSIMTYAIIQAPPVSIGQVHQIGIAEKHLTLEFGENTYYTRNYIY